MSERSSDNPLVLQATGLSKRIGRRTLVDQFALQLHAGDICGFLGPNGAGKTTTLRMLTGLMTPTSGDVYINGHSMRSDRCRALLRVGAIVEAPGLFLHMTGRQNLSNMARLHPNLPTSQRKARVDEVLEMVGLADRAADRVGTYSLGMKQRLGLGLALLAAPTVIILDEPTNGLDPFGVLELRQIILRLRTQEAITFLISSHQLSEVEKICNQFVFIDNGRVLAAGPGDEFLSRHATLEEAFIAIISRRGVSSLD